MTHPPETIQAAMQAARDFAFRQSMSRVCECDGWDEHDEDCPAWPIQLMREQQPALPIGMRVKHRGPDGNATVIGVDGPGGDLLAIKFDTAPRNFRGGECATSLSSLTVLDGDA